MPPIAAPLPAPDRGLPSNHPRRNTSRIAGLLLAAVMIVGSALSAQAGASITPDSGGISGGARVSGGATIPDFVQISASTSHSLALASDGSVWAWGDSFYGQIGDGTKDTRMEPVQVVATWPAGVTILSVSAAVYHSVALASDGSVWAWGLNGGGQLGNGTTIDSPVPVRVNPSWPAGVTIESISAGFYHTVAVASDGSVWAWGANLQGQLGDGTTDNRNEPVRVVANWPAGITLESVDGGFTHTTAVASDGSVWAWGDNNYGQLGNGSNTASATPVQAVAKWPAGVKIGSTTAGGFHSAAVATDGTVWSWGDNIFGQLGDGTSSAQAAPVQVVASWPAGVGIKGVSAGSGQSIAVATDGSVWAWGFNGSGQLGDGTTTDSSVPVQGVANWPAAATIVSVSAGDEHATVVTSNGSLWAWGFNGSGQVGDGTIISRTSAVAVLTQLTATGVTFDSLPGTNLSAVAGTGTFTVTTPAHSAGPVDLTISTQYSNGAPGPTFTLPDGFTYTLTSSPTPPPSTTPTAPPSHSPTPSLTATPTLTPMPTTTAALTLDVAQVVQGGWVQLTATGFSPGEQIDLTLHSDPVQLGSTVAGPAGEMSALVQIPAGTPVGSHTLLATGARSGAVAGAELLVTAAAPTVPDPTEESLESGLAWTGASTSLLGGGGILTLLLGVGLVTTRRRKAKNTHR